MVDPVRAAVTDSARGKINLSDKDFEADLRPARSCVLRFHACSIEIAGIYLNKPEDALSMLARCILALKRDNAKSLDTIRASVGKGLESAEASQPVAARLSCGDAAIEFVGSTLDHGALVLTRALIAAGRDSRLTKILKTHGVTPMLRMT